MYIERVHSEIKYQQIAQMQTHTYNIKSKSSVVYAEAKRTTERENIEDWKSLKCTSNSFSSLINSKVFANNYPANFSCKNVQWFSRVHTQYAGDNCGARSQTSLRGVWGSISSPPGPPKLIQLGSLGSAVSSPSAVQGRPRPQTHFGVFCTIFTSGSDIFGYFYAMQKTKSCLVYDKTDDP